MYLSESGKGTEPLRKSCVLLTRCELVFATRIVDRKTRYRLRPTVAFNKRLYELTDQRTERARAPALTVDPSIQKWSCIKLSSSTERLALAPTSRASGVDCETLLRRSSAPPASSTAGSVGSLPRVSIEVRDGRGPWASMAERDVRGASIRGVEAPEGAMRRGRSMASISSLIGAAGSSSVAARISIWAPLREVLREGLREDAEIEAGSDGSWLLLWPPALDGVDGRGGESSPRTERRSFWDAREARRTGMLRVERVERRAAWWLRSERHRACSTSRATGALRMIHSKCASRSAGEEEGADGPRGPRMRERERRSRKAVQKPGPDEVGALLGGATLGEAAEAGVGAAARAEAGVWAASGSPLPPSSSHGPHTTSASSRR